MKCLDLMTSTPPTNQKTNFDICAKHGDAKISQKVRYKTFHRKTYLT